MQRTAWYIALYSEANQRIMGFRDTEKDIWVADPWAATPWYELEEAESAAFELACRNPTWIGRCMAVRRLAKA